MYGMYAGSLRLPRWGVGGEDEHLLLLGAQEDFFSPLPTMGCE